MSRFQKSVLKSNCKRSILWPPLQADILYTCKTCIMPVRQAVSYLKLIVIYVFYNYFLKVFFHLLYPIVYANSLNNIKRALFFQGKGDTIVAKAISTFFANIAMDLFWLLPYTIVNLYFFTKLIRHLVKNEEKAYQHLSFTLLKLYLFCCLIYLGYANYIFLTTHTYEDSNSPLSPHGSLTITYMLLGNFIFLLIFVPMWNRFLKKKWVM